MAQIIKHRRGSLSTLRSTTARNGELIIATGSISDLQGPFIFIGSPVIGDEGVAGAFNAISRLYQGANAPSISAGTYGSSLDGTPFYASGENKLYILNNSNVGNTTLNLVGNIEGNTISGVTITNLTGTTATFSNQVNVSGSLNVTGSLYINGTSYTAATSGTSGSNGTDGTSGSNGTDGTSGSSGSNGTDGTSGSNGTDGSSGSNGTDGSSGSSGSNGTNGSSGSSGSNGTDGSSGSSGSNGTDGTSGSSGSNGTDGTSGSNGTDGSSGSSGSNGTNGSSGTGFNTINNPANGRLILSDGTTNAATASANLIYTGSNFLINGNTTVTGSLTITGNLTAQQYIVSSSVTYLTESFASGSTKFGDTNDDTHQFTGSVLVEGKVNASSLTGSINFTNLTDVPSGIVSSSTQIKNYGDFATTGSNTFKGNQIITGSVFVTGSLGVTGNVSGSAFYQVSSRTLKTNIEPFTLSGIDLINSVRIVEFNYLNDLDNKHIGFIAEDTPSELSTLNKNVMDTNSTVGVLIKAVQELSEEVKKLKGI
jgi:hypothetical protein